MLPPLIFPSINGRRLTYDKGDLASVSATKHLILVGGVATFPNRYVSQLTCNAAWHISTDDSRPHHVVLLM
jgi:hypothetical protein